jgi:hypothetical protein
LLLKKNTLFDIVAKGVSFSVLLSIFLNLIFYPQLMQYQAGMMAGKWQQKNAPNETIPMFRCNEYSFEFCGNTQLKRENTAFELLANKQASKILIPVKEVKNISADSFDVKKIQVFPYFYVTQITSEFFNYKTRKNTLDSLAIIEVQKKY